MSCFASNETAELKFADDLEITIHAKNVYFYWNTFFSFISMLLNALICVVIIRNPNPLIKIKPMLLANSINNFLFAGSYFFFGRYFFIGYKYIIIVYMGFIKLENPTLMFLTNFTDFILSMASWVMSVTQFVYRYFIVKNNKQPHPFYFITFSLFLLGLHLLAAADINSNERLDEHIHRSREILQYYGFNVQSSRYVKMLNESNKYCDMLYIVLIIFDFLLMMYCAIKIRRLLCRSTAMKSAATRLLNQSMNRTIIAMGIVPTILNIFLTLAFPLLINRCQSNAVLSLLLLTCFLFASSLHACVSIAFIRFYRDAFLTLITFGLYKKPKHTKKVLPLNIGQPRY
ncbi:hypothetical protein M3Y96_00981100 [Aphelenchoides besseyi]|nr:hypothetical protein M3Y96_00981100 [Aphelenchoides besseyi]